MTAPAAPRKIGLIGGLAVRAGLTYYEAIAQRYAAMGRPLRLALNHADVGIVLACVAAGDRTGLGRYLAAIADELFAGGAELVAVTAIAPHMAIDELSRLAAGPVVDALGLIPPAIAARGFTRVAVFGNRTVIDTDIFGHVPGATAIRLDPATVDEVHAIYKDIALHGKRGTKPETERLEQIARLAERDGAQTILLAGTDLSSFYAGRGPAFPSLDVAALHVDEIVRRSLEGADSAT